MSRATERLLDLVFGPQVAIPSIPIRTTAPTVAENVTNEMAIVPESKHGPMLRITAKTSDGAMLHMQEMNLSAVDGMIGKLIQMRDAMAKLKGEK